MKKLVNKVTLGCDPEIFLKRGDEIISAEGLIGGTKHTPKSISVDGHAVQEDNVMVEFNIPPSATRLEFTDNINYVLDYLTLHAKQFDCTLDISASNELDKKYLNTKQAKMFGCDPDFNVYLKEPNNPPSPKSSLRTAGGHIHIGFENPDLEISEKIIYAMDMTLGLESITLDPDDRRREMYGKAGCFRIKEYGVEYRTLSNFWIGSDELMKWAFDKTMEAIELVNSGTVNSILSRLESRIKNCIDNNDKEESISLLKEIEIIKKESLINK